MMTAIAKQLNTALRREYGADIADGVQRYLHEEQFDDESIVDDIKDGVESTIVEQVHMLLGDIAIKPSLVEIHAVLSNMLRAKPKPVSRSPTGTQQLNEQKSKLKPVHGTAHTHLHPPMMLPLHEWDTMVSEHELQHIADLVHKQCGELLPSSKITVDRNLLTVLYLGKKHDLPLLTYLTDAYHRYLLQYHQRKTATELSTNGWFEFCKHNKASAIYAISTKPNAERLWMLYASAINAYCSRMVHVPKLQAMHKIDDSIDIIALYIIRCYQFILNYLTQQHKINDSRLIPTQIDFWIVPQGVRSMLARSQRSYDEDDDDDDDEDNEDSNYSEQKKMDDNDDDVIDIPFKIDIEERLKYVEQKTVFHGVDVTKGTMFSRHVGTGLEKLIHSRNQRLCMILDRSKKKAIKSGDNDKDNCKKKNKKLFALKKDGGDGDGDKDGSKKADKLYIYYLNENLNVSGFETQDTLLCPSLICNTKKCLLPCEHYKGDASSKKIYKWQHIGSFHGVDGYQFTLSFQIYGEGDIRVYLYHDTYVFRFIPSDIINILPQFFKDPKFKNRNLCKQLIQDVMKNQKLMDVQFAKFHQSFTGHSLYEKK